MLSPVERLAESWKRLPPNLRGILWITMGTVAFAFNDVAIKKTGRKFDPFELAFFRYVIGLVIMAPIFVRVGLAGLKTNRPVLHGIRHSIAFVAQVGVLVSVINLPLADVTALSFSRILFTTLIAVVILREVVGRRRWAATAVGFVGVVVMVRPGADAIDPIVLIAIGAAAAFAVANVLIRKLSFTDPPIRILFYYHLSGTLVFAGPAMLVWRQPVGIEWLLVLGIGVLTTLGMVGFVRGFAAGEASVIGPMEYTRLIYAAFLGFAFFGEIPTPWTIAGALIIVGCTSYIARMEARA